MNDSHGARVTRVQMHNRDVPERNAEVTDSLTWIARAVKATTVAEMHDIARDAQAHGQWTDRDAAWCRALRDHLAQVDHAAMNLLVAALGAQDPS